MIMAWAKNEQRCFAVNFSNIPAYFLFSLSFFAIKPHTENIFKEQSPAFQRYFSISNEKRLPA
jgi:hypothetical protein